MDDFFAPDEPLKVPASFVVFLYLVCTVGCIIHIYKKGKEEKKAHSIKTLEEADVLISEIIRNWLIAPTVFAILYVVTIIVNSKIYKYIADVGGIIFIVFILFTFVCLSIGLLIDRIKKK